MRSLTILYGSQTGTAEETAERAWRESKLYHFNGAVLPMNKYKIENLLDESFVLFVCSTTGNGEEPDNMKSFWNFLLRKNLPKDSLVKLKYGVLGLGDSSYIKFNFAARKLMNRLKQLGATPIVDIGLADDQHEFGCDSVIIPFLKKIFEKLLLLCPLSENMKILKETPFLFRYKPIICEENISNERSEIFEEYDIKENNAIKVLVKSNQRVTDIKHFQDVRLIKFKIETPKYKPGDVLMIRPKNSKENVEKLFEILKENNLIREILVKLEPIDDQIVVPEVLKNRIFSLEQLACDYWDLNCVPKRHVFEILAKLTTSDLEKDKCLEFNTAEGLDDYYKYCTRPKRTTLEVLQDFHYASKHLTLDALFEIFQPIQPRAFSIASSPTTHLDEIHILMAVVKYKTKLIKERLGLCSNWLAGLGPKISCCIWIKSGSFVFSNDNLPKILIGPGTGVAPFRSFIFEQINHFNENNNLTLIFGCRNENKDFYFKNEFSNLHKEKKLNLICAFSRDQPHKVYVQHKIKENSELIWQLIEKGASIYLAGNSKNMPTAVKDAFVDIIKMNIVNLDPIEYFEKLVKLQRYQTETWA